MADKFLCLTGTQHLVDKVKALADTKVDKVTGKQLSTNDYTTAEKNKLAGIDLSLYALKTDIASVYRVKGTLSYNEIIALTNAQVGDVYNCSNDGANYVCITANTVGADAWDKLSETVDLSGYVQKDGDKVLSTFDFDIDYKNKLDELDLNYVAKEDGKVLSSNDYTTAEKDKLAGIESGANNYVHPSTDGNKHVPANGTGNSGKFLKATETAGVYEWADVQLATVGIEKITTAEIDAMF